MVFVPHVMPHDPQIPDGCPGGFCLKFNAMDVGVQLPVAPEQVFLTGSGGNVLKQQNIHYNNGNQQGTGGINGFRLLFKINRKIQHQIKSNVTHGGNDTHPYDNFFA